MHVLEKIITFEQEADELIAEAKKKVVQILDQEGEIKKIKKDIETNFIKEKESMEQAFKRRLEEIEKTETEKADEILNNFRNQIQGKIKEAIKIAKGNLLETSRYQT